MVTPKSILNGPRWTYRALTSAAFIGAFWSLATSSLCAQPPLDQAWSILQAGADNKSTDQRVITMRVLGDEQGYLVYYALLTGERKSGESLIGGQEKELNQLMRNPKQMEAMAFEQGMGFVPFGGVGLQAYQVIHENQSKEPIAKATAIRILANDPDPRTAKALAAATKDKHWLVRAAAFDALARRGDAALLPDAAYGLTDDKEEAKLAAAAAVIKLSANPK